ncbi:hypothetical protein [Bordetella avium]|uniref:Uncharacterized protein n=1 Tax=Bordetella avium (strain 197N) TaxID=360910 RepID=Q2KW97_BORA1|nr:hypothetical protein [Bordetella avium]WQE34320.1 hypothetical protein U0029_03855 [Bordetella avium]CAJ50330.1 conserved hypothetical protein [Bordetella avium 197N]SUV67917.1 Uncharacterised protein [Bordetella avium]
MTASTQSPRSDQGELAEDGLERDLDNALIQTFPASDPVSITPEDERPEEDAD